MGSTTRHGPGGPPRRPSASLRALRAGRKVLITSLGATIMVLGVILLPLPGPGMVVVGLGLGLLSTEYHWPGRLGRRLRVESGRLQQHLSDRRAARRAVRRPPRPEGDLQRSGPC